MNGTGPNLLETTYSDDLYIDNSYREPENVPTTEQEEVTTPKATTEAELFSTTQLTTAQVELTTPEEKVTTEPPVVVYTMPDNNLNG